MTYDEMNVLVIDACLKHGVPVIHDRSKGIFFKTQGVDAVLGELPDHIRMIAFEAMTMDAEGWKMLRGDLIANFDEGASIPDALASITDWPREAEYWITVFLRDHDEPTHEPTTLYVWLP